MPKQQEIAETQNGNSLSVTLRLPPELWERFKVVAASDGRSASNAMRVAMRDYMEAR